MKKIELLRDLQVIDSALDEVRLELERCKTRLGDDAELVPLRQEQDAARSQLKSLQDVGKDLDYEIEKRRSKLKADEKKLYDGSIKNPKELGSLAHEVDLEKAQVSKLEDQALSNMEALESASATESSATRALTSADEAWRAEQARLEERRTLLTGRESDLVARRKDAAARLDSATLKSYDMVRRMRGGVAVAVVERGACQGCRVSLSSALVQRARAGVDLVACQNCGRFLYVP